MTCGGVAMFFAVLASICFPEVYGNCDRPDVPSGVNLRVSRVFPSYSPSANLSVRCSYSSDILVGNAFIVCQPNGTWTAYPMCIRVTAATTAPTRDDGNIGGTVGMVLGLVVGIVGIIALSFGLAFLCRKYCPGGCYAQFNSCPPVCVGIDAQGRERELTCCSCGKSAHREINIEHPHRPAEHTDQPQVTNQPRVNNQARVNNQSGLNSQPQVSNQPRVFTQRNVNTVDQTVSFSVDSTVVGGSSSAFGTNRFHRQHGGQDQPLRWHITHSQHRLSLDDEQMARAMGLADPLTEEQGEEEVGAFPKESVLTEEPVPPAYGFVLRNNEEYPEVEKDLPPPYDPSVASGNTTTPPYPV